jgi:hypothetical protein
MNNVVVWLLRSTRLLPCGRQFHPPREGRGRGERAGGEGRIGDRCVTMKRMPKTDPPRQLAGARYRPSQGGWRLLGWRRGTTATPSEIQSDDKSSHSKGGDNILPHFVPPRP